MAPLVIGRRTAADDEELFRLYAQVFGDGLTESSRRRWQWQYLDNPQTGPDGPEIWVAREDRQLLGQYASMPVRLWWGGREVKSSWGMDVFLAEAARGRGLGARLFTTWSDHVEVALGLGLTPSSYGLFKKLCYDDVGPVPFQVKVLDAPALARRKLGPLGALVAPFLDAGLRLYRRGRRADTAGVDVHETADFGAEYDELWERARAGYAMCVRRDQAYLRWKYLACPTRRYTVHEARQGGRLAGYAVSRHEDYRGVRLGWIVDVFTEAADQRARQALLGAVLGTFRTAGVERAQAFALFEPLRDDLRVFGFLGRRSPMQFCVKAKEPAEPVFADVGRWHVTFGDSDMDR